MISNHHPSPNVSPTADEYEESGFEDEGLNGGDDVKKTRGQLESYRRGRYVVLLCLSLGQLLG